jgi:carbon monoxide dehydrogenase subunit G
VLYGLWLAADLATSTPASGWLQGRDVQQRLAVGEVVVRSAVDEHDSRARVQAAVRIHAPPQLVWDVLEDCERASSFIPGLKRCRRISAAADGSWEIIEHEFKYSWLMPTIHSVFRMDNQPPERMQFRRLSGDLKDEQGIWRLIRAADGSTTVEYEVEIDPGFWIPRTLVRHTLRKELPAALLALRTRTETLEAAQHPGNELAAPVPAARVPSSGAPASAGLGVPDAVDPARSERASR